MPQTLIPKPNATRTLRDCLSLCQTLAMSLLTQSPCSPLRLTLAQIELRLLYLLHSEHCSDSLSVSETQLYLDLTRLLGQGHHLVHDQDLNRLLARPLSPRPTS